MRNYLFLLTALILTYSVNSQVSETFLEPVGVEIDSEEYKTLKANGELFSDEYSIISQDATISDHPTVHPSVAGERAGECDCWIEPDDTYTLTNFGANGTDDGSTNNIAYPFDFTLYGTDYSSMWINTNGTVTFDGPDGTFTPSGFPNNDVMLAPFWGDVDFGCANCGDVYYKVTDDAVYVNWVEVGYFNSQSDKLNTFQVIFTPEGSSALDGDNTVQFCYQDMQWTTGSASGGTNGFGGSPANVGASAGNSQDFISFGEFDQEGDDYDGPFGTTDGVSWLDNQTIAFNANISANDNLPPIVLGSITCDTITLCANDVEILEFTFLTPEEGQNISVTVDDDGFPDIDLDVTDGSTANVTLILSSGLVAGEYSIVITGTDDGTPPASTSIDLFIEVLDIEVPDLDITMDGELVSSASYCQGQEGVFLEATEGFDSYLWSDGTDTQSDFFEQGAYTLTAFFMGCDTEAGPVNVFEIPVFNPDVSIDDIFICAGETTLISIDNPDDYEFFEWSVYNNDGEIISEDLLSPEIEVTPGFYEVVVTDDNGCPGSRIVPVAEEIVNIPNTDFTALCDDDDEICWSGGWAQPQDCAHFIYLWDSEGDTWEGANIQVYVDGTGPFNFNIANGNTFLPTGLQAYNGQVLEYYFVPGLDDDDINVSLFECGNTTPIFDSTQPGDELVEGLFYIQNANTDVNAIPGTWNVDVPAGGEGYDLGFTDVFNPEGDSNCFTAPEGFSGTYTLSFESDICETEIEFPLTFASSPTISVTDYTGCGNDGVTISPEYGPNGVGDLEYDWTPNSLGSNETAFTDASMSFIIEVSNDCGNAQGTGVVTITPVPEANLTDYTLCNGESATLDPVSNDDDSFVYDWSTGSDEASINTTSAGTTTVTVTNDCGTSTATSNIVTANSPSVIFWEVDTLICPGEVIEIDPVWNGGAGAGGPVSWTTSWIDSEGNPAGNVFDETGDVLTFGSDNIPLDAVTSGVTVSYSTSNICGTASGNVLAYTDACYIGAYNIITPDSDGGEGSVFGTNGLNEGWQIIGIDGLSNIYVRIFDRWGNLVYENANYKNNLPWKGDHTNGEALQDGVYFYTVDTPRTQIALQGTVTILRKQ